MSIHGIQFLKNIIQVLFRQLKVPEPKTIEAFTITSKLSLYIQLQQIKFKKNSLNTQQLI